jgi:very-short-patch-repair endonuclease
MAGRPTLLAPAQNLRSRSFPVSEIGEGDRGGEVKQPSQRQWQTDAGLWSKLRPSAREHRAKPTPAEAHLWQALRNRNLAGFKFRRQHAVGRFLVDFYCAEAALVVEIDGPVHQLQAPEDEARQAELEARGLKVLRFTNDEVQQDLLSVTARIEAPAFKKLPPLRNRRGGPRG